jgi:predicted RND superfamily exporter protein
MAPEGVNNAKQTAGLDWCLMMTEKKFVETMKQGLSISIIFAFVALLVATSNIIMAFYSALTIGMIIINVMAFIPYMGWQLGSSESVGVVICVGFAVDYVVHLASHYTHSKQFDRQERIRESLREMGISILSGSLTTMCASLTLYLCVITSFHKFALFVLSTIVFSIFYSLFFFAAICSLAGPNGKTGNLVHLASSTTEWFHF